MSERQLFNYVTPLVYPLFPDRIGRLMVALNLHRVVAARAERSYTGPLDVRIDQVVDGDLEHSETVSLAISDGSVSPPVLARRFQSAGLGYVEISISAREPIFGKIQISPGYGMVERCDGGRFTVIPDVKYARPLIIESVRSVAKFCAVHDAACVDPDRNLGNSYLLVNPYKKEILARIMGEQQTRVTQRLLPGHAAMVALDPVIPDGPLGCVMVTGNNRLPVWDIRHAHDDPDQISNVDHLDIFRGGATHRRVPPVAAARAWGRRTLREMGLRIR